MRFKYFKIKNFKGINSVRLDFEANPRSNVYTLVGLNESGKTTILEALNFLSYRSETLDPLNLPGYSVKDVHELIPISKRSNFNDEIIIEAGYEADSEFNKEIKNYLQKEFDFILTKDITNFTILQSYQFEDSKLKTKVPQIICSISFEGKRKGGRKTIRLTGENWRTSVKFVRNFLPSVLYFPNFLFEFPDKIYLEEAPEDPQKHEFYKILLQDVLDSIEGNMNLDKHVIARAKSDDRNDKQALDSVLLKMSSNMSSCIFNNWNRIFKRKVGKKEILINYGLDEKYGCYIQLRIKDADELYSISERSLGFKWFFAFLLLTYYRGFRKDAPKNPLFLFDEPASNLHPSAQTQLLESFDQLSENCSILYTTHSHHMINPNWLEGAYVVKNGGLEYDANEDDEYTARKTIVTLSKYREFVSQHPNQTTYFQPVLDILDYCPSKLESVDNVVMLEGKNDFYTLKYIKEILTNKDLDYGLLPGGGAGNLDGAIRLYIAWGRQFIILLDSDEEGNLQKKRYEDIFGVLMRDRIFSFESISEDWKGKGLEKIFEEDDKSVIQKSIFNDSKKYHKAHFNRSVQELFMTKTKLELSTKTIQNFEKIFEFCDEKLRILCD